MMFVRKGKAIVRNYFWYAVEEFSKMTAVTAVHFVYLRPWPAVGLSKSSFQVSPSLALAFATSSLPLATWLVVAREISVRENRSVRGKKLISSTWLALVASLPGSVIMQEFWERSNYDMYQLGEFVHYKSKITFRIALHFLTNIKYSQHVSTRLSVGTRWTILTAAR